MAQKHPLGQALLASGTCGECVWLRRDDSEASQFTCVASGQLAQPDWSACVLKEDELDCLKCAACCGPAFDVVEVEPEDPVVRKHPEVIGKADGRLHILRRSTNRCGCLMGDNTCSIYKDRPICCREFERGSGNFIFARRRVSISPPWAL